MRAVSASVSSMRRSTRRGTRPPRRPMNRTRTPLPWSSSRRGDEEALVEVHEEPHFVERAAPVLGGERVHRHPLEPDLERTLDRVEQGLLAGRVAVGALQAAALRPPTVAVHDDRDVLGHVRPQLGQALGIQLHHDDATYARRSRRSPRLHRSFTTLRPRAGARGPDASCRTGERGLEVAAAMTWTVIVNPVAGRGRTRKLVPEIEERAAAVRRQGRGVAHPRRSDPPRARGRRPRARSRRVRWRRRSSRRWRASRPTRRAPSPSCPPAPGNDFARVLGYDPKRPARRVRRARARPRPRHRPRTGQRALVHVRRPASGFDAEANRWANTVHRLSGTVALHRGRAADARGVPAASVPGHGRRRGARGPRVAGRGRERAGVRRRHEHRAERASLDDGLLDVTVVGDDDPRADAR